MVKTPGWADLKGKLEVHYEHIKLETPSRYSSGSQMKAIGYKSLKLRKKFKLKYTYIWK